MKIKIKVLSVFNFYPKKEKKRKRILISKENVTKIITKKIRNFLTQRYFQNCCLYRFE